MKSFAAGLVFVLVLASGMAGCGLSLGCPTALLSGTLIVLEDGETLGVQGSDGTIVDVAWPFGWHLQAGEPDTLRDFRGTTLARVGDHVQMGGGSSDAPELFRPCPDRIEVVAD